MSRPHGAFHTKTTTKVVKAPSFHVGRKALVDILENLSFVKVVSVQMNPKGIYHGEAIEVHFRNTKDRPKLVFFDKLGRSRSLMRIGPIQLAQAPLGFDHPGSVPTVGDILVGSLVPNARKSHLDHVLRGWTSDAKPLWELLRILKFGTKSSEFEARSILLQPAASMIQAQDHLKATRDDIYMVARVILWGNLRPLQIMASKQMSIPLKEPATETELEQVTDIRLSNGPSEFLDLLMAKLNDSALMERYLDGFTVEPPKSEASLSHQHDEGPAYSRVPYANAEPYLPTTEPYLPTAEPYVPKSPLYGSVTPPLCEYTPVSPIGSPEQEAQRTAPKESIQISLLQEPSVQLYEPYGPPSPMYEKY